MQIKPFEWKDEYNIGTEIVDRAHRRLFTTARRLILLVEQREKRLWACKEGIAFFKNYALNHFAEEEAYMRSIGYEGLAQHARMHADFRNRTLPALEKQLAETDFSSTAIKRSLGVCIGWLTGHIMMEDQAIAGRGRERWIYGQEENRLQTLENAVIHIIRQMFSLEAELVSANYSGEHLELPLCYELNYANEDGAALQALFIVEESLILETTGRMTSLRFQSINEIVLSAVKETTNIIMQQIAYCLRMQDAGYRYESDALRSVDDVAAKFAREEQPLCSLLFQTEYGCFAVCMDARGGGRAGQA